MCLIRLIVFVILDHRGLGQFAVRHGEAEVRRRVGDLEEQATGLLRMFGVLDAQEPGFPPAQGSPATGPDAAPAEGGSVAVRHIETEVAPVAVSTASGNGHAPVPPAAADLAITDYDSLSASQVVTRLEGLAVDELEAVRAYEATHRGRKTILNKVAQLQG